MCGAWRITLSVPLSHNSQWMLLSADKAEAEAWRRHGEGKSPAQWPTQGAQSVLRLYSVANSGRSERAQIYSVSEG